MLLPRRPILRSIDVPDRSADIKNVWFQPLDRVQKLQAARIQSRPDQGQTAAAVHGAKRMNEAAFIPGYGTRRPRLFSSVQQGSQRSRVDSGHIAGHDDIELAPSAVERRLDTAQRPQPGPQIGNAIHSKVLVILGSTHERHSAGCGGSFMRYFLHQKAAFQRQQRLVAAHSPAEPAHKHKSGRPHAQIVAPGRAFSGYNANKTNFVFLVMSLCRVVPVLALLSLAAAQSQTPQPPRVEAIRFWSFGDVTRIAIQTQGRYKLTTDQVENPARIYFDLSGLLPPAVAHHGIQTIQVGDHRVKEIRVAEVSPGKTRIVFDLEGPVEVASSQLVNPDRLMVEIRPKGAGLPALSITHSVTASQQVNVYSEQVSNAGQTNTPQFSPLPSSSSAPSYAVKPPPLTGEACASDASSATQSTCAIPESVAAIHKIADSPEPTSKLTAAELRPLTANRLIGAAAPAKKDSSGDRSLVRVFGLKLGKVVIDAGHGGHDTGTIGPHGLMEKDLALDVALRLGKLISRQLGAEVVYTRSDDTFIPLEERTRIANAEKADLFISIHANSSPEPSATGVETYFFNLTADKTVLDLATRENATSTSSISDLNDLLHRAVLQTKLEESREFAQRVQASMWATSVRMNGRSRDRGVRQAPFVVLIGATMPSILAEIGFVSNPHDERLFEHNDQRQKLAEALFKGISQYANSLSHVQMARSRAE